MFMRQLFLGVAFFSIALLGTTAFARGEPLHDIPLRWTPTATLAEWGAVDISGPMAAAKVRVEPFADSRENPGLVGENRENSEKIRQVTTTGDVASFIADHLKEGLRGAGLSIVDSGGDLIISGEIRRFFVTEVNTYGGEISVLVHVKNSAGKELWSGVIAGDSTRWGRSYSAANYYETMSDMILSATHNLLANPGFHDALAKP
jgi:hypothetical protein